MKISTTIVPPSSAVSSSSSFEFVNNNAENIVANLTTSYQPFAESNSANTNDDEDSDRTSESIKDVIDSDVDLYSFLTGNSNSDNSGSSSNSGSSQMDSTIDHQQSINSSSEGSSSMVTTEIDSGAVTPVVPTVSSSSSQQLHVVANWISKHNSSSSSLPSSLSWSSEHRPSKQKQQQQQPKMIESLAPSSSNQHHLTTIATIANSISATFLPTAPHHNQHHLHPNHQQNIINNSLRNDYLNFSSSSSSSSSSFFQPMAPVGNIYNNNNISYEEDNDYDWSSQDYQFMINLSIGGIILTTLILLTFLLWLCCSKNDRDQYSIRKVPGSHHHDRNSINTSLDSIDVVINPNHHLHHHQKQRRSNCSLYINNPNSEDSQPDLQCVSNNSNGAIGSITFHNQMASDQKPVTVIRQYNADCGYKIGSHHTTYDAILQPNKCCNGTNKLSMMVGSNWMAVEASNGNINNNVGTDLKGSQLARNLATYCEQQNQKQILIHKAKDTSSSTSNKRDYCHQDEGISSLDAKSSNLSGNNDHQEMITTTTTDQLLLPIELRANFTKKRRNRMHNDSAAAIALNRSGLLLMAIDEYPLGGHNNTIQCSTTVTKKASPDAILTYYDKISKLDPQQQQSFNKQPLTTIAATNVSEFDDIDDLDNELHKSKKHQTSPETSSGDSIILNNHLNQHSPPIVVYNERTVL